MKATVGVESLAERQEPHLRRVRTPVVVPAPAVQRQNAGIVLQNVWQRRVAEGKLFQLYLVIRQLKRMDAASPPVSLGVVFEEQERSPQFIAGADKVTAACVI